MGNLGKGIATFGIWATVAFCVHSIGPLAIAVAFFAMLSTSEIWK